MAKEQITKEEVDKLEKFYNETRQEFGRKLLRELAKESESHGGYISTVDIFELFSSHGITLG